MKIFTNFIDFYFAEISIYISVGATVEATSFLQIRGRVGTGMKVNKVVWLECVPVYTPVDLQAALLLHTGYAWRKCQVYHPVTISVHTRLEDCDKTQ